MSRIYLFLLTSLFISCGNQNDDLTIASPDNNVSVHFSTDHDGQFFYAVSFNGKEILTKSRLGFMAENHNLADGFRVVSTKKVATNRQWTQPWGENKIITDQNNELEIHLKNNDQVQLTLRCKVFNDGIGIRYEYSVANADSVNLKEELTQFRFAVDGVSWATPANFQTYELLYDKQSISELKSANTPATFKFENGIYGSIHEAALINFPDMTLIKDSADGLLFHAELAPLPNGLKAVLPASFTSPWRTLQLSDKAVGLINSALILNLNEPSQISDTSWIKPTKYIGVWWGMHLGIEGWAMGDRHGATTENAKRYIDFAADNQIESVLFEGWNEGWENWGTTQAFDFTKPYADFDMDAIVQYAREKQVNIIGHHETGGNIVNYEQQMEKAFDWYRSHAINMVKTGYAGGFSHGYFHHSQYAVNHYKRVVEMAAKHRIMLDVHEPIKPTGERRTYPNMMTREGVRGMEWNAWSEGNPPNHTVTIPFTRMLAGPVDYTPGIFDILYENTRHSKNRKKWNEQDKGNSRVNSTLAKQIANWVILYSPMQMAADLIENYEGHPAFQFFRDFDADYDASEALMGEPGEFIVIVRQAKDKFFLGASTNDQAREVQVSLDFLKKGKTYDAVIYADAPDADWKTNPTAYVILRQKVTANDTIVVKMVEGGGQAVTFIPK